MSLPIEQFLSPISPENSCGDNKWDDLAYGSILGGELDSILGTSDGMVAGERAQSSGGDWRNFLAQVGGFFSLTKHLGLANYAIIADIHISGLSGLNDGLAIINLLLNNHWDEVHPQIDEGDAEERIEFIESLNDPLILSGLDTIEIARGRQSGNFTLADIISSRKDDDPNPSLVEASINETLRENPEHFATLSEQLAEINVQLNSLKETITSNLPEESFSTKPLEDKLQSLATALAAASGEEVDPEEEGNEQGSSSGTSSGEKSAARISGEVCSRDDVVKTINSIIRFYSKNEPTSPVPLLLERAKRIVNMDFMQVVEEFDLKNRSLPFAEVFGEDKDDDEINNGI